MAVVNFRQVYENYRSSANFLTTFFHGTRYVLKLARYRLFSPKTFRPKSRIVKSSEGFEAVQGQAGGHREVRRRRGQPWQDVRGQAGRGGDEPAAAGVDFMNQPFCRKLFG
jgi:hypothetical protein